MLDLGHGPDFDPGGGQIRNCQASLAVQESVLVHTGNGAPGGKAVQWAKSESPSQPVERHAAVVLPRVGEVGTETQSAEIVQAAKGLGGNVLARGPGTRDF